PLVGVLPGRVVNKGEAWTASCRQDLGPIGNWLTQHRYTYEGPARDLDVIRVETTLQYAPPRASDPAGLPFTILGANLKSRSGSGVVHFNRAPGRIADATLHTRIEGNLVLNVGGMNTAVELVQSQKTTLQTSA